MNELVRREGDKNLSIVNLNDVDDIPSVRINETDFKHAFLISHPKKG